MTTKKISLLVLLTLTYNASAMFKVEKYKVVCKKEKNKSTASLSIGRNLFSLTKRKETKEKHLYFKFKNTECSFFTPKSLSIIGFTKNEIPSNEEDRKIVSFLQKVIKKVKIKKQTIILKRIISLTKYIEHKVTYEKDKKNNITASYLDGNEVITLIVKKNKDFELHRRERGHSKKFSSETTENFHKEKTSSFCTDEFYLLKDALEIFKKTNKEEEIITFKKTIIPKCLTDLFRESYIKPI